MKGEALFFAALLVVLWCLATLLNQPGFHEFFFPYSPWWLLGLWWKNAYLRTSKGDVDPGTLPSSRVNQISVNHELIGWWVFQIVKAIVYIVYFLKNKKIPYILKLAIGCFRIFPCKNLCLKVSLKGFRWKRGTMYQPSPIQGIGRHLNKNLLQPGIFLQLHDFMLRFLANICSIPHLSWCAMTCHDIRLCIFDIFVSFCHMEYKKCFQNHLGYLGIHLLNPSS